MRKGTLRPQKRSLGELIAEAEDILTAPDTHPFDPSLLLEFLVVIAKRLNTEPDWPPDLMRGGRNP
jgi:hypothetical protein